MPRIPPRANMHHDHQQHADAEIPVLGKLLREPVLRHQVDHRADERAVEAADAAQYQHDQQLARRLEAEHVEAHELVDLREQRAGDPCEAAEIVYTMTRRQYTGAPTACMRSRILPDAGERRAERRIDDSAHNLPAGEEHGEAIEIGCLPKRSNLNRPSSGAIEHARESVGPAGDRRRLVGDLEHDRGDGERQHEQGQGARAQDHCAGGDAEQRRRRSAAAYELHERIGDAELRAQNAGGVRAEAEERAVAERDDAGVAEDEVERQGANTIRSRMRAPSARYSGRRKKHASAITKGSHSVQRMRGSTV